MSDLLLNIDGLEKTFKQGGNSLTVFKDLSLQVAPAEIVALVGQSGSGKSTLLHIAGLLDKQTAGTVQVFGNDAARLPEKRRTQIRAHGIGFVYQFHHLLPEFSAQENVAMGAIVDGMKISDAKDKAASVLHSLGLSKRMDHRPGQLSGGEQQRVAIGRALINDPVLLLADEPTGNLDPENSEEVFAILMEQVRQRRMGALIATHNHELARRMDRILELRGGKIV
jgi:lipoprotein-releasing system ATP-binding protein